MYPCTSLDVVHALWSERDQEGIRSAVRRFPLIAFLLADPSEHADLDDLLAKSWEEIDRDTGEHLLVVATFKGAREAGQKHRRRRMNAALRRAIEPIAVDPLRGRVALQALTALAGIPLEYLPCLLIVRGDPRAAPIGDPESIWLPTSASSLLGQIDALVGVARRRRLSLTELAERHLGIAPPPRRFDIRRETVRVLSALIRTGPGSTGSKREDQLLFAGHPDDWAAARTGTLALERLRPNDFDEGRTARVDGTSTLLPPADLQHFATVLDSTSHTYLVSASLAHEALADCGELAPVAIQFGRAFERTINLSLVHLFRRRCRIDLPEYFEEVQPGVQAKLGTVDLNAGYGVGTSGRVPWRGPTLGASFELVRREGARLQPLDLELDDLMRDWSEIILPLRNAAAHDRPNRVEAADIDRIVESFRSLLERGTWKGLADLRAELGGPPPPAGKHDIRWAASVRVTVPWPAEEVEPLLVDCPSTVEIDRSETLTVELSEAAMLWKADHSGLCSPMEFSAWLGRHAALLLQIREEGARGEVARRQDPSRLELRRRLEASLEDASRHLTARYQVEACLREVGRNAHASFLSKSSALASQVPDRLRATLAKLARVLETLQGACERESAESDLRRGSELTPIGVLRRTLNDRRLREVVDPLLKQLRANEAPQQCVARLVEAIAGSIPADTPHSESVDVHDLERTITAALELLCDGSDRTLAEVRAALWRQDKDRRGAAASTRSNWVRTEDDRALVAGACDSIKRELAEWQCPIQMDDVKELRAAALAAEAPVRAERASHAERLARICNDLTPGALLEFSEVPAWIRDDRALCERCDVEAKRWIALGQRD